MLPTNGYAADRMARLLINPAPVWERYVKHFDTAESGTAELARSAVIRLVAKEHGVEEATEILAVVRRSFVLLYEALGKDIASALMKIQPHEVIAAVIPYATMSSGEVENKLGALDVQMALLASVIVRVCEECDSRHTPSFLYAILNELPLPYYKHQILIDAVNANMSVVETRSTH